MTDSSLPSTAARQGRVIYDFGSNNGDDIPYYLKKAQTVVAVEANPLLCKHIRRRFSEAIAQGRLFVENCVLTAGDSASQVFFHIHKRAHFLSQFPEPDVPADFDKVLLPSRSVAALLSQYGTPHYVKIDIEHYDGPILRALFESGIRPPFISAESHSIEVFALLVALGRYDAFKLVDGQSVSTRFRDHPIRSKGRDERHSFPTHSAGPFGNDIPGEWMDANTFFQVLAAEQLGWKDIHATNRHAAGTGRATDSIPARGQAGMKVVPATWHTKDSA